MSRLLQELNKRFDLNKLSEYFIIFTYFIALFSTTCFFFDTHKVTLFGSVIQLPVAITFFPITFALSNVIQDKFGPRATNSLMLASLTFDTLLVFAGFFLASVGDRADYWSVFRDMPTIMLSTWFFLGVSFIFNIKLYAYLSRLPGRSVFMRILKFFITITATETLISSMSIPLLFYKHGLEGSLILTAILVIIYKILVNILLTFFYWFFNRNR